MFVYKYVSLTIDTTKIKLSNKKHQKEYDKSLVMLRIISIEKGIESKEFKDARENAKNSLSKFVMYSSYGMH